MHDSQIMSDPQKEEQENEFPSRPRSTKELVSRFENPKTSLKEKEKALKPLVEGMIKIFRDDRKLSHTLEAAALAPILAEDEYKYLALALGDAVCQGVGDDNALNPQLLDMFISVLWRAEKTQIACFQLGRILVNLHKRLNSAIEQAAAHQIQYQIVCALSSVLEAMYQVETAGLSREAIHSPLGNQLSDLCKYKDLRLAQAACCTYQALQGIPDNEGPYKVLWQSSLTMVGGIAKVASVAVNLDPSKLVEGVTDLSTIPEMVSSLVESIQKLNSMAQGLKLPQKQKIWHVALGFTNTLIQEGSFSYLYHFIEQLPCLKDKEFLCGICAQLEPVWDTGDKLVKEEVIKFWQKFQRFTNNSTHDRVHAWVDLTSHTLGQPGRGSTSRLQLWGENKYTFETTFRKTGNIAVARDLLEQAWLRCRTAQVFYADMSIRKHYLQGGRLVVEGLSGESLPIDMCYINLAVIKGSAEYQKSSGFSLSARLKVKTPPEKSRVQLESLFVKQGDSKGTSLKRILIRGQAGVGKSTLCKKMVHNYLKQEMWTEMFDRVLWIPLRSLKLSNKVGYKLTDWLRDEYFRVDSDDDCFIQAMKQAIVSPNEEFGRTLFILDGLDEVSGELSSQTEANTLIVDLLKRPNVIITSRPGTSLPHPISNIDLELETVGFYPDQVNDYIRKSAKQNIANAKSTPEAITSAIQQFIQQHWLVQGLVRIPIQLEALCYSWDATGPEAALTTMTALYQAIELKLWRKDAVRLEKKYHNKSLYAKMANEIPDVDILDLVPQENRLLEGLAFTGLCANVIEFEKEYQNKIRNQWSRIASGPVNILNLAEMSFMRSSDRRFRSYHFLHLTFQEYFAAKYFVDRWTADPPGLCPVFSGNEITRVGCEDFLSKEKYTERFDIFWRFVAGLLQRCGPEAEAEAQLRRFFDTIEKEPLDILGSTHQRLVMHCLSEVESPSIRTQLERKLSQWILFECNHTGSSILAREAECPDEVVRSVLESEHGKRGMLNALVDSHVHVSAATFKVLIALVNDTDSEIKSNAATALRYLSHLPPEAITGLIALFQDKESYVRSSAAKALGRISQLPSEAITGLIALLQDKERDVRYSAAEALGKISQLSSEAIIDLVALLQNKESYIRHSAAEALEKISQLPSETITDLIALLQNKESYIQYSAALALGNISQLPSEATTDFVALLQDKDSNVRYSATIALRNISQLPSEAIIGLVALLQDKESCIRYSATIALRNISQLPSEAITGLIALLQDKESYVVRGSAALALGNMSQLPSEAITGLVALLQDKKSYVQRNAAFALEKISQLPLEAITGLVALLQNKESGVRGSAALALGKISQLPSEAIIGLVALLQDKESFVQYSAAEALEKISQLPSEAITDLVALLQDKKSFVRGSTAKALGNISQLPSEAITGLVALLQDKKSFVRGSAAKTLGNISQLPSEAITGLVALLQDKESYVRSSAAKALGNMSQLPLEAITAVMIHLRGNDTYARRSIADVLNRGVQLLDCILEAMRFLLQPEDSAEPPRLICNIEFVEGLYGAWLQQSFKEHLSLYIDNNSKGKGKGCVVLNLQNGSRKAFFENEGQQQKFLNAIRRGRQLWVDQQWQGVWGDDIGMAVQDTVESESAAEAHSPTEVDTNFHGTPDTKGQNIFLSWLLYLLYGILKTLTSLAEKWMKKIEQNDDDQSAS